MTELLCIVNNEFVPLSHAALPVSDLAIQRGYGVFDFFRTAHGKPVFWEAHLGRLERSCAEMRLPIDRAGLLASLRDLVARNGLADSGIRITVTGGCSPDAYSIAPPNVVIVQQPLALPPATPLRLITWEHQRQLPHVKTIDYTMAIYLRKHVQDRGADDVLYHSGGMLRECPRANVFVVLADGTLVTPAQGILAGITRGHVLKLAGELVSTLERDVSLAELRDAREAFITSTSRGVVPVIQVDGLPVANGQPGPVTLSLMKRFEKHLKSELD